MSLLTCHNSSLSQPKEKSSSENLQLIANTNLQLIANRMCDLSETEERITQYLQASLAPNSQKAYRSDLVHFAKWGGTIPASPQEIAAYLADHAVSLAIATLARRLVSISRAHTAQGHTSPVKAELVRATFDGIRRLHGTPQRAVAPVIKSELIAMVTGLSGLKGVRDKALLLIGFAGAFRRSELVALNIEDLDFTGQGIAIHIPHSKTDQVGVGRKIGIPFGRGGICPVESLKQWLACGGIDRGPIFRAVTRHGVVADGRLSSQAIAEIVKARAQAVGLDSRRYSGHSLRAGLVTSAAQAGVSAWKIRQQTGHQSDEMLARYIRDARLFVDNAAGAIL